MGRVTRVVLLVFFAVLLMGRAVETHHHHEDDRVSHPESCVVCRALQAPVTTPERSFQFDLLLAERAPVRLQPTALAPESTILGVHPLRAPPLV